MCPGLLSFPQRAERFFGVHFRIDPVQLVKIDTLELQSLQAVVHALFQAFGSAVRSPLTRTRPSRSPFGCDHNSLWIGMHRFCDEQFALLWTGGVGGID